MVIDGAQNCAYDCYAVEDDLFKIIFPAHGQDIEFIEDVVERLRSSKGVNGGDVDFSVIWNNYVERTRICGIDGILFYELQSKKNFYPNKRDSDLDGKGRSMPKRRDATSEV